MDFWQKKIFLRYFVGNIFQKDNHKAMVPFKEQLTLKKRQFWEIFYLYRFSGLWFRVMLKAASCRGYFSTVTRLVLGSAGWYWLVQISTGWLKMVRYSRVQVWTSVGYWVTLVVIIWRLADWLVHDFLYRWLKVEGWMLSFLLVTLTKLTNVFPDWRWASELARVQGTG